MVCDAREQVRRGEAKVCVVCGELFTRGERTERNWASSRFCSPDCRGRYHAGHCRAAGGNAFWEALTWGEIPGELAVAYAEAKRQAREAYLRSLLRDRRSA